MAASKSNYVRSLVKYRMNEVILAEWLDQRFGVNGYTYKVRKSFNENLKAAHRKTSVRGYLHFSMTMLTRTPQ